MEILWVRHLSRGNLEFFKSLLDSLCRELPDGATSEGALLDIWNFKFTFCRESSGGATSWWATFSKNNILKKWKEAKWSSGLAPPQKVIWGVQLETIGACHVAGEHEWRKQNAPPQRGDFCTFSDAGRSGHVAVQDKCQLSGEVLLKWRHLRGKFEIQMEVGPGGMKDGHVAPPQGGSYSAMWQEGGKGGKGHVAPSQAIWKNQSSGFAPPRPLFEFLNGLLFLKKAKSDMCLLLFWEK